MRIGASLSNYQYRHSSFGNQAGGRMKQDNDQSFENQKNQQQQRQQQQQNPLNLARQIQSQTQVNPYSAVQVGQQAYLSGNNTPFNQQQNRMGKAQGKQQANNATQSAKAGQSAAQEAYMNRGDTTGRAAEGQMTFPTEIKQMENPMRQVFEISRSLQGELTAVPEQQRNELRGILSIIGRQAKSRMSESKRKAKQLKRSSKAVDRRGKQMIKQGMVLKTRGIAKITQGVAQTARGAAFIASGVALLSNPFTVSKGLALIAKGVAMVQQGIANIKKGKALIEQGKQMEKKGKRVRERAKSIRKQRHLTIVGGERNARKLLNILFDLRMKIKSKMNIDMNKLKAKLKQALGGFKKKPNAVGRFKNQEGASQSDRRVGGSVTPISKDVGNIFAA